MALRLGGEQPLQAASLWRNGDQVVYYVATTCHLSLGLVGLMRSGEPARCQQGSLWRRWDPHVHLPGTALNDNFGSTTIEAALDELAERTPPIEVVGVTDYVTTATYRAALKAWQSGAGRTLELLYPNVELRLDVPTSRNRAVNLHLLCAPENVDRLDQFLGSLEFSWNGRSYRADTTGLVALGRDFSGNRDLEHQAALRQGINQFKVSFEDLRRRLTSDAWARDAILVAVAGGEGDGSSGVRAEDGSFAARRQSIEALARIIFSSNAQQITYWQGRGVVPRSEITRTYGGVKLCIHGSDAHDTERLGRPDGDRFTWLKGDPTFDTLRLACLAPDSRSHIGPAPPTTGFAHGRMACVAVASSGWFSNGSVPINPGLVAIIGARGSGKTALADLMAAGAGSDEPFANPKSFVRRAGRLLYDSVATVEWTHGEVTTCSVRDGPPSDIALRPVRYLSQQFVERLCASDGVSDELLEEIKRVVFDAWPPEQRLGAASFDELLAVRLTAARTRKNAELEAISDLSEQITAQRGLRGSLPQRRVELAERTRAQQLLEQEATSLTRQSDRANAERLALVNAILADLQQRVQAIDRRRTAIQALAAAVATVRSTSLPKLTEQLLRQHIDASLSVDEQRAFRLDFVGNVDSVLRAAETDANQQYRALLGEIAASAEASSLAGVPAQELRRYSVAVLNLERERLERVVGLDEARTRRLAKVNEGLAKVRGAIQRLEDDISAGESAPETLASLTTDRLEHYSAYFDALLEEERELQALYRPLDDVMSSFGASISKLRFSVRRTVDVSRWAESGEALLDLRVGGRFRGVGELARVAEEELSEAWETGDGAAAAEAIRAFAGRYSGDLRKHMLVHTNRPDAIASWENDVAKWLYSADHVGLRYSLEYDGLSIERLSPGTRGIVLLLLYLAVDRHEADPLIIDQPEENLDPESVYSELVALFQAASKRRQIVMVTHNANLVVNTDVDQVIVARCGALEEGRLPRLSYLAGGLENEDIRRAVCEVLEGGAEAFRERARRLGIGVAL